MLTLCCVPLFSRAKKAARIIAIEEEHQALIEEDNRCPFYKKYWRKFYRMATHGVNVDVFDVRLHFFIVLIIL